MKIKQILVLACVCFSESLFAQQPLYKQANAPIEDRVQDLLGRMTDEEKVGQLVCLLGWKMYTKEGNNVDVSEAFKKVMDNGKPIGSLWALLRADPWTQKTLATGLNPELAAEVTNKIQRYAVEKTRLGIPLLLAEECPHGHMAIGTTVFPTGIGMSSTWNKDLLYTVGEAVALEARSQGANIGYGPVLDLAREPRWSRVEETYGEDPVLTGTMGVSYMKGIQGKSRNDGKHLSSTLKHFTAYGIPEGGHNGGRAHVGNRELFTSYLHPFRKGVEAGAETLMTAYNLIDGVPCSSNKFLLTDVLRNQWGFNGFLYSDLSSINGLVSFGLAPNLKEAGKLSLEAGLDMDLGGAAYGDNTLELLKEKRLDIKYVDRAVANILRLKFKMGLFENPYVSPKEAKKIASNSKHRTLAREVARQGIVLLKNDGILPLSKKVKSIAVIGPNADMMYNQLGDYTAPQREKDIVTPLEGIQNQVSSSTKVRYVKGCAIRDVKSSNIQEAVDAANASEVIVLVVGGSSARDFETEFIETGAATVSNKKKETLMDMECGEGFDRCSLSLLGDQEKLMKALIATEKPLVVVYIQGRPLNMNLASEKANALLNAWYPGEEGGNAIADILFGNYNPSGRLPVSVPRSEGQLPVYYSQGKSKSYVEGEGAPLYAFGYGLSYTKFAYSDLQILPGDGKDVLQKVSCVVTNQGSRDGHEVVQLYLHDEIASVSVDPISLKAFEHVFIPKGESRKIVFELKKEDLSLFNAQMKEVVEPGDFKVMIGAASNDIRLQGKFNLSSEQCMK